jgi:hypothetical protein
VDIWRLRHSMPMDEEEQGDTAIEYMAVVSRGLMPFFGDHAAGLSPGEAAEQRLRSVEQEPEHQRSEPTELYIEVQTTVVV